MATGTSKEIVFTADREGEVEITVNGAKGTECTDLTRTLEKCFGPQLGQRELKPEYTEVEEPRVEHKLSE